MAVESVYCVDHKCVDHKLERAIHVRLNQVHRAVPLARQQSSQVVINLRPLSQVRRRLVAAWTQLRPAGALAIGGFGRSRCAADAGELWVLFGRFEDLSPLDGAGGWSK